MVWQKLDVECMWSARLHNQREDIGSNPIGIDQKENFLKIQVMKKQHKISGYEQVKSLALAIKRLLVMSRADKSNCCSYR